MSYDPSQDEKLTAYALGELDGAELAAVERTLAEHEEARAYVQEIRRTAEMIGRELRAEPAVSLTTEQVRRLRIAAPRNPMFIRVTARVLALAAVVAMAAVVWVALQPRREAGGAGQPMYSVAVAPEAATAVEERSKLFAPDVIVVDGLQTNDQGRSGSRVPAAAEIAPVAGAPLMSESQGVRMTTRSTPATLSLNDGEVRVERVDTIPPLDHRYFSPDWNRRGLVPSRARGTIIVIQPRPPEFHTEGYDSISENPFRRAIDHPLSTFSIDVDTASYSNVRRFIAMGQLPPPGAVRIEEMVNYFPYYYAAGREVVGEHPFITNLEVAGCPWNAEHRLVRVGLQARDVEKGKRPPSNLVFLIDVSGSMNEPNKLPLVQQSLRMLVGELGENDRVAIVVYAGASGLVLDSTPAVRRDEILAAIDRLQAGGSTNGGAGIQQAYQVAAANSIQGGTNRVILATDGDFNVGVTDRSSLAKLIEDKRKTGVFLSVLGYGMGNLKDSTMEELSNNGNGNYAYIDSLREARKVLVEQMGGTLVTVAKDVKIQVEFNPATVAGYRLIGYENRVLAKEDFNDDRKDAGEIGAGHTVTALYEIVPAGKAAEGVPAVDELKYQSGTGAPPVVGRDGRATDELLTLKLRYKQLDTDVSTKVEYPVTDPGKEYAAASADFKFAAAVAGFGMILRDSPHKGTISYNAVLELAQEGVGEDRGGYRAEFVEMVRKARQIAGKN